MHATPASAASVQTFRSRVSAASRTGIARISRITLTLLGALALGVLGMGGTYAFLNATATASSAATVTAGTAALSVTTAPAALTNLYPGQTQRASFVVRNTGDVALALSMASLSSGNTTAQLSAGVALGDCTNQPASGISTGALGVSVAPNATTTLCLVVGMPTTASTAAVNQSSTISLSLTGAQQ